MFCVHESLPCFYLPLSTVLLFHIHSLPEAIGLSHELKNVTLTIAEKHPGGSLLHYQNYITWVPGKVSKMGEVGPTFIVKNNWRAAEVDWLGGCRHRHPQPGRGSRDLRGERLHGSRDCRGNHLRRLVRVHQRRDEDRLHWLAPQRRHLGDAREVEGRRAGAART